MIEMMIIAAIVAKVGLDSAGKFAVDVGFGVRGKASPRLTQARARRTPGAASRYFSELWDDAWTDASKRRTAKRTDPSRPRGPFRVFWSNAWRDGWVGLERKRQDRTARPRPETVTVPGTVVPDFQDEPQDGPQDEDYGDDQPDEDLDCDENSEDVERQHLFVPDGDGRTDLTFGDDPTDPTGTKRCPECRGAVLVDGDVCLSCRDRQEQRNQHHDQQEDEIAEPTQHRWLITPPDGKPAFTTNDPEMYTNLGWGTPTPVEGYERGTGFQITSYYPARKHTTPQEGSIMTATTTEVTGLESGITFSETSAQAYSTMVGSIEQTIAALGGFDVGGPAKAAAHAAMEQSAAAAQSMLTLAEELKKHRGVAEAIDATPGAGTREFYTAGR